MRESEQEAVMVEPIWGAASTTAELGDLLAHLRRERDLTQGRLAESAGVPRRFVNELEGGHATIYLRRLFDVLDALGVRLVVEEPGVTRVHHGEAHAIVHVSARGEGERLKDLGW